MSRKKGWAVNLVNEAGVPGRGATDMVRIWMPAWKSRRGFLAGRMTIQFDSGKIWRRDLGGPRRRGRR